MRALLLLAAAGCAAGERRTEIVVQRFFGECGAVYGASTDIATAEGECGLITTMLQRFEAENPDVDLELNVVAWPGYAQLTAQIAAGDPPDLVTMHQGVISDYQGRGLLEPMDGILAEAGISPDAFTAAGRRGVTREGEVYGLPWDTVGGLWHVNTRLFAEAGLTRDGEPVLPTSADELLEQARRFVAATGKPYLVQAQVNDPATHVRNLWTYLLAQDAVFFPDPEHVRLRTPEARRVVELFRTIDEEGLTTRHQDYPAAVASFTNGEGGALLTGTWMLGPLDAESRTPGRPLYRSYAVAPYPPLFGHPAAFVDGHAWVMPARERTPEQLDALARLLRFLADHEGDWARTGHLPSFQAVVESPAFLALPHRADLAPLAGYGQVLPGYVRRQAAIEGMVGEELAAAISGQKPVEQALADAERRVHDLLSRL